MWEFSIVAWTTSSVQCFENGVRLWCFAYAVGHARSRSIKQREKRKTRTNWTLIEGFCDAANHLQPTRRHQEGTLTEDATTFRVAESGDDQPRVATEGGGPSQPWANMWNPVGVRLEESFTPISAISTKSEAQTFYYFLLRLYIESGSELPPRCYTHSANPFR